MGKVKFNVRTIAVVLLVVFIGMQAIRQDRSVPEVDQTKDFLVIANPPEQVAATIRSACYDCHSYQTVYPWYAQIAPVSWIINHHVEDGRKHLNFAIWGDYSAKKADHKLEECVESMETKWMPLESYVPLHPEANLTDDQRKELAAWFESLRPAYQAQMQ